MSPDQFTEFGPVMLFQNALLKGVDQMLKAIARRKESKENKVS